MAKDEDPKDQDGELDSFKIGDKMGRPGMTAPPQGRRATAESDMADEGGFSLGFARIETMLENEDPVLVGESLNRVLADLESYQSSASSNRDKLAAKKAIVAVERAVDLMDYLFETKAALEAEVQES